MDAKRTADVIAKRILELRAERGLSRDAVLRMLWVAGFQTTQTTLRALEGGTNDRIDVLLLLALAKAFGVPLDYLLGEEGQETPATNPLLTRFSQLVATVGETEVEPHLRALELLFSERQVRPAGKRKPSG